ncbi:PilI type IV pilus biogenesis protein [Rhodococcus sp. IEGM 1366]|uniref:type IV pilus biogenesis protein PilI n=1 Tax=Rhodococcus sp. IEGM 1366 TaxID=3082223 RepID=UPI0029540341|nr:PilI type IV pilus biogenesis protein [Rhodococcus sp. IEGM 1366]MDV8070662.1 PilI type IV pilus biogenesis protein [Rhodococcus sp. IEGM 1366]
MHLITHSDHLQTENFVPDRYQGVWRRRLIKRDSGMIDATTHVYWMQTRRIFADIRIPVINLEQKSLNRYSGEEISPLLNQRGFAGVTSVKDDICQWNIAFDYQPLKEDPDIGIMRFTKNERLIEVDVNNRFLEIWERLPGSVGASHAYWFKSADDHDRQACLLVSGDYFFFAADRSTSVQSGGHLVDQMNSSLDLRERTAKLQSEYSFGRFSPRFPWQIAISTIPDRIGKALLPASIGIHESSIRHAEPLFPQLGRYAPTNGWIRTATP